LPHGAGVPWRPSFELSSKSSQKGVGAVGLISISLVTPCGAVLCAIYPHLRACKLLRRLALPWWRMIGYNLGVAYHLCVEKRKRQTLLSRHEKPWSPGIGDLLVGGHETYHHALFCMVWSLRSGSPWSIVRFLVRSLVRVAWLVAPKGSPSYS
jgi:hypothetical protein